MLKSAKICGTIVLVELIGFDDPIPVSAAQQAANAVSGTSVVNDSPVDCQSASGPSRSEKSVRLMM